ncbi:MAG: TauD/TfdA family dioxygenase [Rhodospirillaceae bacterium]|jgi:hypothetical protein|nr:TauD/TfdA family dioxygenase [Rhodospirillaceae bacterium]
MPEEIESIAGPQVWRGPDMAGRIDEWRQEMSATHIAELDAAVEGVLSRGLEIVDIHKDDFPLPSLGKVLDELRGDVLAGRGFAVLGGVPVDRYDMNRSAIAYFGIGSHFGESVSQNAKGHALGHVRNLGFDYKRALTRGYQTNSRLPYHTDASDVVGLLCLRPGKSGGLSSIVSSGALFNEIRARRPDLLSVLMAPFYRDRRGEIPAGKNPWYVIPVFNWCEGKLLTSYVRSTVMKAQRFPEAPRLTEAQIEAMDYVDELAQDPAFHLRMSFNPGDIQFLNNHFIVHSRTEYEEDPDKPRHLLRLWLACPEGPALPPPYWDFQDPTESGRPNGYLMPGVALSAPLTPEDGGPGASNTRQ